MRARAQRHRLPPENGRETGIACGSASGQVKFHKRTIVVVVVFIFE